MWTRSRLIARIIRIPGDFPRPSINKEKSWKVCVPPRGGVTGHVSETRLQWPPLILVASGIGERTRESRDADSAFLPRGGNIYDARKINDTLCISGGGVCVRDKDRQRITLRSDFPCGRERERERSIKVRRKGFRSFVKNGDVDDLKIER